MMVRLLLVCVLSVPTAFAQQPEELAGPTELPTEIVEGFQERLDAIREQQQQIERLQKRLEQTDNPLETEIISARKDVLWGSMFESTVNLARDLYEQEEAGFDVSNFTAQIGRDLERFPDEAIAAIARVVQRTEFPASDLPANKLILLDKELMRSAADYDGIIDALITYTTLAEKLGLDASTQIDFLREEVLDSAANRSMWLQLALDKVDTLRDVAAALPADEEITAQLAVAESRIKWASHMLQRSLDLMRRLGLDSRRYRQQIVTATGELTTDVLDVGVFAGLIGELTSKAWYALSEDGPRLIFRLLLFFLIIIAFWWLGRLVQLGVERAMQSSRVSMSSLLRRTVVATSKNLVILLGILVALSQIGLSLGPLLAGLGIAGFIVGFALQDSLSNFASGMLILMYRPFDVGDYVQAGGVNGQVKHMSLVNTTLMTFDNQKVIVPNNMIWQQVITNDTAQPTRRIDLVFGVSYSADLDNVEAVVREVLSEQEEILKSPEPSVEVHELGEYSVNLIVRPWVRTADYWPLYWRLTKAIKQRFDQEGIEIPFPQRVVHSPATGSKTGN